MTRTIKTLEKNAKAHVEVARCADVASLSFSDSGKAIRFSRPRHTGEFWCPASLVRQAEDWQSKSFGNAILIPAWFLQQERIPY